ncbi:MAG: DUF4198 domain-containing protein [Moraxellaceae bacterium]|nr:MAG: DUF4198 domain-containing protein [Moraxellaceae bacterium]
MFKAMISIGLLSTSLMLTSTVSAHQAYILPLSDLPQGKQVLLHAGYTEDLFVPEFPLKAQYYRVNPQGQQQEIAPVTGLQSATLIELPLEQQGTYKIFALVEHSTNYVQQKGIWKAVYDMPASQAPAASERPYLLSSEVKDTDQKRVSKAYGQVVSYVSKGSPTSQVLTPSGKGLELKFDQHPNQLKQAEGLAFQVLFDGKPVANTGLHVEQAGGVHADAAEDTPDAVSDKDGKVQIQFKQLGQYLIKTSYPKTKTDEQPAADVYHYALTITVR